MNENSKALKVGSVIALVVFILSFLPYLFVLGLGIDSAINGFTFFMSTSYGLDAFASAVFFALF